MSILIPVWRGRPPLRGLLAAGALEFPRLAPNVPMRLLAEVVEGGLYLDLREDLSTTRPYRDVFMALIPELAEARMSHGTDSRRLQSPAPYSFEIARRRIGRPQGAVQTFPLRVPQPGS